MGESLEQALTPATWPTFAFVLTRLAGFMGAAPLWSLSGIPSRVRAAVAVVLGIALLPMAPRVALPAGMLQLPVSLAMEFVVGLAIGLSAAVIVYGMSLAGEVLSIQMGLSLGPAVSPMAELAVPGIGQLQSFLAVLIYLSVGGHLMLLHGLADSLKALPPGSGIAPLCGSELATELLGTVFGTAVRVAAPALVALLLTHVAVAITGRAVPQIHAIVLAFPLTIGIGLLMVGASLPFAGATLTNWMAQIPERAAQVVQSFHLASGGP
jgi:flagellar biosynthetic protein FliR